MSGGFSSRGEWDYDGDHEGGSPSPPHREPPKLVEVLIGLAFWAAIIGLLVWACIPR